MRTKVGLFFAIAGAITLLVLFGVTFLVIAAIGGVVTLIANLFRTKPVSPPPAEDPFPTARPFSKSRMRKKDDDIIDI
ncbi:MAG: hypothetical protein GWN88_26380 [Nitrospinaceae bacterium]|nr:hypothetical protein [Nitrospinaceae bacterium]NIS88329.1 hypothetical protein [Nitrospinaceae bacterium]NIU47357.1 hypothetical protein [Nitrospinaceae bacterium]NIU99577.1 hypothetical protein [Nitrospinaceae bacterium]NIW62106.1 hypothetical protein [Nitrospinaceae bacterium]